MGKALAIRSVQAKWTQSILVCGHERAADSDRESCGAIAGSELRAWLKDRVREEGLRGQILVVKTGCLGVCSAYGVTLAIQPESRPRRLIVFDPTADRNDLWAEVSGILGR
jgi:predicted metal-binding protein